MDFCFLMSYNFDRKLTEVVAMEEIDVFKSLRESADGELTPMDEREAARFKLIADYKAWLKEIKKEHPSPYQFFKVGV